MEDTALDDSWRELPWKDEHEATHATNDVPDVAEYHNAYLQGPGRFKLDPGASIYLVFGLDVAKGATSNIQVAA